MTHFSVLVLKCVYKKKYANPPFLRIRYLKSLCLFRRRQIVARTVLETLRAISDDAEDVDAVLSVISKLADDADPSVRTELMEQIPHIAMYCCQEYSNNAINNTTTTTAAINNKLTFVVPDHLLPLIVKFLTDTNSQVRKTSQAALLVLLEQGLVERADVREQVCPVIISLTEADSLDDYRTEAVAVS